MNWKKRIPVFPQTQSVCAAIMRNQKPKVRLDAIAF
jgi:hypothetical protein